jgi:hypothetical protein
MAENKESVIDKLLDPKRLKSICILIVVITLCAIVLTKSGTSVEIGSVKITKAPVTTEYIQDKE